MGDQTVTVEATAYRTHEPEVATIEGMVFGEGDGPAEAEARARDRASTVRESVGAVVPQGVRSTGFQVDEVDDMFGPETEADFRAEETFEIDCLPETVEPTVAEITGAGGTVRGVEFDLRSATQRKLEGEAVQAALERAREQAERIATAEGSTISEVRSVSASVAAGSSGIADELLADADESGPTLNPVEVGKRIEAVYELTDP